MIKKLFATSVFFFSLTTNAALDAIPGKFIVKVKSSGDEVSALELEQALSPYGFRVHDTINAREGLFVAQVKDDGVARVEEISNIPGIEYVEPDYIYRAFDVTPKASKFASQWALHNAGQTDGQGIKGKPGADINAPKAWALSTGSKNVIVAVLDSGIDYTHPNLKDNIWSKPGSPAIHGHNFVTDPDHPDHVINPDDPMDDNSHGTHCAGIIGANGNFKDGISGVNWTVTLMAVKFLDGTGSGDLADAIKAVDWAVDNGAQVISASWGGLKISQALQDSIKRAGDHGVLFVAAAGNNTQDSDVTPMYPAAHALDLTNVVSVAASNNQDILADFSNWGGKSVTLMAPGDGILSTILNGNYASYSGTSMAAPVVAGASALLLAREPNLKPDQVRARLVSSSVKFKSLQTRLVSAGRLDLYNLLANVNVPGFTSIPDGAWSAPIATNIGTAHPYGLAYTKTWTVSQPGAKYIRIHFKKFATEAGYDFLKLISAQTNEVMAKMSGKLPDNSWSIEVPGSSVTLLFNSDETTDDYGFDIDSYEWTAFGG